jgi:hypothetical protein
MTEIGDIPSKASLLGAVTDIFSASNRYHEGIMSFRSRGSEVGLRTGCC